MPAIELLVDGLDHPEGVAWDPSSGVLLHPARWAVDV